MTHKDINYKVRGDEAKDSDKKMSWRYVQLIFFAKHLRISEKKCTSAAKKRTKQPIFLGKSGQNTI